MKPEPTYEQLKAENARLAAKCAEMRSAMECDDDDVDTWNHALSDDFGKGWLSPEKKEMLVGYMRHLPSCAIYDYLSGPCSCGLQKALDEIQ